MKSRVFLAAAIGAAFLASAAPAAAQQFSESYEFLEAVKKGDNNKVQAVLDDKSNRILNAKTRDTGEGALHIIARQRNSTYLSVFLNQPEINVNIQDRSGNTPLMTAIDAGWEEGVNKLIAKRANVNLANSGGETPLIRAVLLHNQDLVAALLAAGANPDKADYRGGMSARDYAARETRYPGIAKLLANAPKGGSAAGTSGPRL